MRNGRGGVGEVEKDVVGRGQYQGGGNRTWLLDMDKASQKGTLTDSQGSA
jgi:hypothetical protein